MTINARIRSQSRVLSRNPRYAMIQIVDEKTYINSFTGDVFSNIESAMSSAEAMSVADLVEIAESGSVTTGKITGVDVSVNRVVRINNYLADPANRVALEEAGLGELSGGSLSGKLVRFDTTGVEVTSEQGVKERPLSIIRRLIRDNLPGESMATDEGLMLFSLSKGVSSTGSGVNVSYAQQQVLKSLTGTDIFESNDLLDIFGNLSSAVKGTPESNTALERIGKTVGKLTKRYKSTISPRDVSSGAEIIQEMISSSILSSDVAYLHDEVESMLKIAAGGYDELSDLDKLLLKNFTDGASSVSGTVDFGLSKKAFAFKDSDSASDVAFRQISEAVQLTGDDLSTIEVSGRLREIIGQSLGQQKIDPSRSLIEIIEESGMNIEDLPENKTLKQTIGRIRGALETFRDGSYILPKQAQLEILEIKKRELSRKKSTMSALLSDEDFRKIGELEAEIDALQISVEDGGRNPTRVQLGNLGEMKGESSVRSFSDISGLTNEDLAYMDREQVRLRQIMSGIPEVRNADGTVVREVLARSLDGGEQQSLDYVDRMFQLKARFDRLLAIGSDVALKTDIITSDYSIAQNITVRGGSTVASEPMLLMNNPLFVTDPNFQKRIQANVQSQIDAAKRFQEFGEIPQAVMSDISQNNLDLTGLSSKAKALQIRNRTEGREISELLRGGVDPREIPALVNRIKVHLSTQAVTMGGENKATQVIMPDAFRVKLATRTSSALAFDESMEAVSRVGVGTSSGAKELTMINFVVRGKEFVIADSNAATYKAALSGFDLDDSGIPIMQTYRDSSNRTRIVMSTMRDPKGPEEMLLTRANLRDSETLSLMMGITDEGTGVRRQLQLLDADGFTRVISRMTDQGVEEKLAERVLRIASDLVGNTKDSRLIQKNLTELGDDSTYALETLVRISQEGKFGRNFAEDIVGLSEVSPKIIDYLAGRGSAAVRGQDFIGEDGRPVGIARGLGVEEGGDYSFKNYQELRRLPDVATVDSANAFAGSLNRSLSEQGARRALTNDEIGSFLLETSEGVRIRADLGISLAQARGAGSASILDYVSAMGDGDVDSSIGVSMNRQASATSLANQSDDFIESTLNPALRRAGISEKRAEEIYNLTKYTVMPVPPSDVVDMINQASGASRVKSLASTAAELEGGVNHVAYQRTRAGYEALARHAGPGVTADNIHEVSLKSNVFAKAQLDQQSRMMGKERAMAIAAGVDSKELPGFDPGITRSDGSGRLKSRKDIDMVKAGVLDEYDQTIKSLEEDGFDRSGLDRLREARDALRIADEQTTRGMLSLNPEGQLYKKYAGVSIAENMAENATAQLESSIPKSPRSRRLAGDAVSDARYSADARSFLKSKKITSLFEELKSVQDATINLRRSETTFEKARVAMISGELSEELSKGVRALAEIHRPSGANVLDIIDTVDAEMSSAFGAKTGKLLSGSGEPGFESDLIELYEAASLRRSLKKASFDLSTSQDLGRKFDDFASVRRADDFGISSFPSFNQITSENAQAFLAGSSTPFDPELEDYFKSISDPNRQSDSLKVAEAIRIRNNRASLEAQESVGRDYMGRLGEPMPGSPDIEDIKRTISDSSSSSPLIDEVFDVTKSNYRRFSDMIKDSDSSLRQLMDSKNFKTFSAGAVALIAGSFIYQNKKQKDLTQDNIGGSPLMPGGNPYETGYPDLQTARQDSPQSNPTIAGMQYRVNTSGSIQDLNRLRGLFGDVSQDPIDATMYDGLPMAGQDPYSSLASRF